MKKLLSLLLAVAVCLSVSVMLTACGHEHTYVTEWSKDATHHWHACEGEGCTDVSDKAEHTWNAGEVTTQPTPTAAGVKTYTCTVCAGTKTEPVEYVVDYTVTEEEWRINFNLTKGQNGVAPTSSGQLTEITSYTIYAVGRNKLDENSDTWLEGTCLLKVAPDAMSIEFYLGGELREDESGTYPSTDVFYNGLTTSIMMYFPFAEQYNDFTFDTTKNAYVAERLTSVLADEYDPSETYNLYTKTAEVTFINGYLNTVTVELCDETFENVYSSFVFTFSNMNNTTVEE